MHIREVTDTGSANKTPSPAQQRVKVLKQQTQQAQQQVKRERANQQLKRARQAVARANSISEGTRAMHTYQVRVVVDALPCVTTVVADSLLAARKIAEHWFGKGNVRGVE